MAGDRRSPGETVSRPARVLLVVTRRLLGVSTILVGGIFFRPAGAVIVVVILVAAYPVVTYVHSQTKLTKKASELARTMPEMLALKRSEADAFTGFFVAVIRGLSIPPSNSGQPLRPHDTPPHIPASERVPPAITDDTRHHPPRIRGIGQANEGRARHRSSPGWPPEFRDTRLHRTPEAGGAGTDPAGTDPAGTDPAGTDPAGTDPAGANPAGANPATGMDAAGDSGPGFFSSLTISQQDALIRRGRRKSFAPGQTLCHQGGAADHVIFIMSGRARVFVDDSRGRRLIAERGPGDLVGERAALRVRPRSATVIAVEPVQALIVSTEDFTSFVAERPAVLELIEQQIYDRLAEGGSFSRPPGSPAWAGQNCSILFTDIAGFASVARDDHDRQVIRRVLYGILTTAFDAARIPWRRCHHEDRGDGVLIIVPPEIPTGWIAERIVGRLATALRRHNRVAESATRIQLRAALNVGPILSDAEGVCGQAVNHAARLLEAAPLKRKLAETKADLGFITSEFVFDNVIRHIPGLDDRANYWQVSFRAKESRITAWVQLK